MPDSRISKKRKSLDNGKNNETRDGSQSSSKQQKLNSKGQSSQRSPRLSPFTPNTRQRKLMPPYGDSPGTGSIVTTRTGNRRDKTGSRSKIDAILWSETSNSSGESTGLKPDENDQQLEQYVEAKQLSNYRSKVGPIYGSTSFQKERIIERLETLSESTKRTIEMGLEMADGAYLMQIMNISTPIDGIEKAWQTAHTGATLLLKGELLLKECQATLKSLVLPALRSDS